MAETTLFDSAGVPVAYIDHADEDTIYAFSGEPLAYIDKGEHIYGFNGIHIGWFQDGVLWDHSGARAGFTGSTCPVFTKFEPFKGFKKFKPFRAFQKFAPFQPFKNSNNLGMPLHDWLARGRA
ncbi:hypothetical protein NX871_21685 [Burkholderia thailandensis]|uniref:4-fold beta flower protein n=1 Tax=Burkholderia thailandensis TaxID=57975 RepID=UPI00217DFF61|nr:hypothetical protein [Burkholderia thailandensis]MCS6472547.1 hypothetical protein [Burkholderia thailandensis]